MLSWFWIYNLLAFALAAPVPENGQTVSWVPSPKTRGTLSILFSCAVALVLCVWTGVHLNVHRVGNKRKRFPKFSNLLGRSVWAGIALLAPDIVLAIALHQLLVARKYRHMVNEVSRHTEKKYRGKEGPATDRKDMTLKMAFFATMGGFAIEANTVHGQQLYNLNVEDLETVGMMDRIHDYPLADIEDKSKASGFAKLLACFQAGWVLLEFAARLSQGIFITVLELNTAVHVIFALVMYVVWGSKPADVSRPLIIDRRGTNRGSTTDFFIIPNCVQQVLGNALHVLEGRDNRMNTVKPHSQSREVQLAAVLCQSVKEGPEEIAKMVKRIPEEIKKYFANTLRKDIYDGVKEDWYFQAFAIPLPVMECAYREAFSVAHDTAFKMAHDNIYRTIHRLSSSAAPSPPAPARALNYGHLDEPIEEEYPLTNDHEEPSELEDFITARGKVRSTLRKLLNRHFNKALKELQTLLTCDLHKARLQLVIDKVQPELLEKCFDHTQKHFPFRTWDKQPPAMNHLNAALENAGTELRKGIANALDEAIRTEVSTALETALAQAKTDFPKSLSENLEKIRQDIELKKKALNRPPNALESFLEDLSRDPGRSELLPEALEKAQEDLSEAIEKARKEALIDQLVQEANDVEETLPDKVTNKLKEALSQFRDSQPSAQVPPAEDHTEAGTGHTTSASGALTTPHTAAQYTRPAEPGNDQTEIADEITPDGAPTETTAQEKGPKANEKGSKCPPSLITALQNVYTALREEVERAFPKTATNRLDCSLNKSQAAVRRVFEETFASAGTAINSKLTAAIEKSLIEIVQEITASFSKAQIVRTVPEKNASTDKALKILRTALASGLDNVVLHLELTDALDNACLLTRKATFKAALRAAFHSAKRQTTRAPSASTTSPAENPDATPDRKDAQLVSLKAAVRAAHAASRAASRQAVRLAALDATLGKDAASGMARTAFTRVLECLLTEAGMKTAESEPHIIKAVWFVQNAIENAFRDQYRTGTNRANIGSDVTSTIALVRNATYTGIYDATQAVVRSNAQRGLEDVRDIWSRAGRELSRLEKPEGPKHPGGTFWERLMGSFITASEVVFGQLILVPGLFWRANRSETGQGSADTAKGGAVMGAESEVPSDKDVTSSTIKEVGEEAMKHAKGMRDSVRGLYGGGSGGIVFKEPWKNSHRMLLGFFILVAGGAYGGMHVTKWNDGKFPTTIERDIWRISCCIGSATIVPVATLAIVPFLTNRLIRHLWIALCVLSWGVFLSARSYIIIESFISLRALPKDAFQTVEWSAAIPHI